MTLEAVQVERRILTVADYHKMIEAKILGDNDRVELIYGQLINMSAVSSSHSGRVNRISSYFIRNLSPEKYVICVQNPITLTNENSEPEPDVAIARYREDFYTESHPVPADIHLLIEVSNTTLNYDRKVKTKLYAEANIAEYWIVNTDKGEIEIYREPTNGQYISVKKYKKGEKLSFSLSKEKIEVNTLIG